MSSIWSSAASQASESPFASGGIGPSPGGGAAAKFQSILQSSGKQQQSEGQLGLSPAASSKANVGKAMTSGTDSSNSSTSDTSDATISANDFLTLLVTEMQNQDPTADTDPNEYINQLVQINSLEQLIDINQNLSDVLGTASSSTQPSGQVQSATGTGATASAKAQAAAKIASGAGATGPGMSGNANSSSGTGSTFSEAGRSRAATAHGNLSAPPDSHAAHKVGHALDGSNRMAGHGHAIRDIPTRPLS
jgi:flagellar basal-body rod modification protein FlgD